LQAIRETGGRADAVTEGEIVDAILLLARTEGIFTETAGGVTVGVLAKLAAAGVFHPGERVVALITGMGLKTIEAVSDRAGPTVTIGASLAEFEAKIESGDLLDGKALS
jgi:threonine synthase